MKFGVVVFPGSNRDHDAWYAILKISDKRPSSSGTMPPTLGNVDAVILPGGFSYGDYLRCGAIAKFSPVMQSIRKFAAGWRPGAGHLQRISDSGGKRAAAGRAGAQSRAEVHLQTGAAARRDHQLARSPAEAAKGPAPGGSDRAWRRLLHRRRAHARSTGSRGSRGAALSRESQRIACATSPAS